MSNTEITNFIHDRHARGHTKIGWLESYHTFSFGEFYAPDRMGFRALRVINDDRVSPGAGFGTHSHQNMEIVTYVLEGALQHKDSLGNGEIIRPGDAQIMSAGTGITHSEFNAAQDEPVHFLQIWIIPDRLGLQPRYEQKYFSPADRQGKLRLIVDPQGREGAVTIYQNVQIYSAVLDLGEQITYDLPVHRSGWLQVAQGVVWLNGEELRAGDGVEMPGGQQLEIIGTSTRSELLLFDLT